MGPLLNLGRVDAAQIADFLYGLFHRDFVVERTNFAEKNLDQSTKSPT